MTDTKERPVYLRTHIPRDTIDQFYTVLDQIAESLIKEGRNVKNPQRAGEVISYSKVIRELVREAAEKRGFDGESVL